MAEKAGLATYGSRRSRLSRLLLATPLLLACGTAPMDSTGGTGTMPGTMPDSAVPWAFQESTPWGSGGSDEACGMRPVVGLRAATPQQ